MSKIYKFSENEVYENLLKGKVGVIPTDTVYGIACSAKDENAIKKLYELKKRDNKPGTVIAASVQQLIELGLKQRYLKPVEHMWPNPISVVIPSYLALKEIHLGKGSIAVRIPNNEELMELLERTGPLLTTSANMPSKPESQNIQEAIEIFEDNVDFYVDGGVLNNMSSTVIRVTDDMFETLRQGAVKIDETGRIKN